MKDFKIFTREEVLRSALFGRSFRYAKLFYELSMDEYYEILTQALNSMESRGFALHRDQNLVGKDLNRALRWRDTHQGHDFWKVLHSASRNDWEQYCPFREL